MLHDYKGSTFGQKFKLPVAPSDNSKRIVSLTTNPLNPWYLSNGIPDFSPKVDKSYEILTLKRKGATLEGNQSNDDNSETVANDDDGPETKKTRSDSSSKKNEKKTMSPPHVDNTDDKNNKRKLSSEEESKSKEKINEVSLAQSLLNSIQKEKQESKVLEEKIMGSFGKEQK
jgi:hypothetical protein